MGAGRRGTAARYPDKMKGEDFWEMRFGKIFPVMKEDIRQAV